MYFCNVIFPTLCVFRTKCMSNNKVAINARFRQIRANHPYVFGLVNNAGFAIIQLDGQFGL